MSKINAIRIINLNYNNNGIKVDDEIFDLRGESTLLSLRNGGGKSVLVQMMIAPFVHKRYRDIKDRQFSSYFTSNKPTIILVEWKLDGQAGYALTGMMVRKSQETQEDEGKSDLDIIQFIHEYKEPNPYDIRSLPIIEVSETSKKLKNYSACKQLFEGLRNDKKLNFHLYDMNIQSHTRNYFEKLSEYQIYYKEWESIIKKVNLKESGLSELFIDAKDEKGLIEKWFLDVVENKLNKEKNRIQEFRDILSKYIKQYKENKSKIDQKDTIVLFKDETKAILDKAESFREAIENTRSIENKIANLIVILKELRDLSIEDKNKLEESLKSLKYAIEEIEYEEFSFEIYNLLDEKAKYEQENLDIREKIQKSKDDIDSLTKQKNIQECAKIYSEYKDASKEVQICENQLDIIKKDSEDTAPERNSLGFTLKCHYEKEEATQKQNIKKLEDKINKNQETIKKLKQSVKDNNNQQNKANGKLGSINQVIKQYSDIETRFNNIYNESLNRNILGLYEEGKLELKLKNYNEILESNKNEITKLKTLENENEEKLHSYNRQIEDLTKESSFIEKDIEKIEKEIQDFNAEIDKRKTLLRYIDFNEDKLFNTDQILRGFQGKIDEIAIKVKEYEREYESVNKEFKRLESGQILELPEDFKKVLDESGIYYIYGMDWLKKNNKSYEENKLIVENNPFIPYGLIMTEKEFNSFITKELSVYTSFPIPIIKREILEAKYNKEKTSIYQSNKVSFYMLFNDNLLDEEELRNLLQSKKDILNKIEESLSTRKEEIEFFLEKYNAIKYQKFTEESYNKAKDSLKKLQENKLACEKEINDIKEKKSRLEKAQKQISDNINNENKEIDYLEYKIRDFLELQNQYINYLNKLREKTELESFIKNLKINFKITSDEIDNLESFNKDADSGRRDGKDRLESIGKKLTIYSHYKEGQIINKDIEDIESRYEALTSKIASNQMEIEKQLENANKRFKEYEKELIRKSKKYNLIDDEYKNETYDYFVEENIEKSIADKLKEISKLKETEAKLNVDIKVQEAKIENKKDRLKEKLGKIELKPREQIIISEFKLLINEKQLEYEKIKGKLEEVNKKISAYEDNLSNLIPYENLAITEDYKFDLDLSRLNKEGLNKIRGELIRDHNNANKAQTAKEQELSQVINTVTRIQEFQEDFFKKPLDTLYALINNPIDMINQLTTTIRAYDDLVTKLEIDIAIIKREEDKVVEMLLDYIEDIHKNIGKIDKNSTIRIREKSVKMLRINLPKWEEEENIYKIRLSDLVESLTESGIISLEKNENIEEFIGTQITTKNLYNTVVGINNIEIKLYKIEAEREYQISWVEVAKNSGGEGFLSAFVILSSLLSFIRRDDTDIFAEHEEGKVLVMDNPFAQTNASHLLKPLMDIAKKSNTQLICLSGLGGESIYNRFDNIYILNLIYSNLRKGMQYLKSEHIKGEREVEIMVSSQIRTEDATQLGLELLF